MANNPQQPDLFGSGEAFVPPLPASWLAALEPEFKKPYWTALQEFVAHERASHEVFPPDDEVYTAFSLTLFEKVRVFLLGQDPYPTPGQAHGLCFSVKPGVSLPASLRNMFKELQADLGIPVASSGSLIPWAKQGMLMLNAVLTVRAGKPNSHQGKGWESFTDAVIRSVNAQSERVIFVLWGGYAQKKLKLIDAQKHTIIKSAHPSPLSAHTGFFGSRPFSKINEALVEMGSEPINWDLKGF